eukprot:scaffold5477_cov124-Isochrysis_galbana.AAC.7
MRRCGCGGRVGAPRLQIGANPNTHNSIGPRDTSRGGKCGSARARTRERRGKRSKSWCAGPRRPLVRCHCISVAQQPQSTASRPVICA